MQGGNPGRLLARQGLFFFGLEAHFDLSHIIENALLFCRVELVLLILVCLKSFGRSRRVNIIGLFYGRDSVSQGGSNLAFFLCSGGHT